MQRGLMAEDEWRDLGLSNDSLADGAAETAEQAGTGTELRGEFVAGAKLAKRRKEKNNPRPDR